MKKPIINLTTKEPKPKQNKKERRGGYRPNAGRKPLKEKRIRFNSYITETQAKDWGNGDMPTGVVVVKKMVQRELDKLKKP